MTKKVELKFPVLVVYEECVPVVCYGCLQLQEAIDKWSYGDLEDIIDDCYFYPVSIGTDGTITIGNQIHGVEAKASYTFVTN